MKTTILTILFSLMMISDARAQEFSCEVESDYKIRDSDNINQDTGVRLSGTQVCIGEPVRRTFTKNNGQKGTDFFRQVKLADGSTGWIAASGVENVKPVAVSAATPAQLQPTSPAPIADFGGNIMTVEEGYRIRTSPDASGTRNVIGQTTGTESVQLVYQDGMLQVENGFVKVNVGGKEAWVSEESLGGAENFMIPVVDPLPPAPVTTTASLSTSKPPTETPKVTTTPAPIANSEMVKAGNALAAQEAAADADAAEQIARRKLIQAQLDYQAGRIRAEELRKAQVAADLARTEEDEARLRAAIAESNLSEESKAAITDRASLDAEIERRKALAEEARARLELNRLKQVYADYQAGRIEAEALRVQQEKTRQAAVQANQLAAYNSMVAQEAAEDARIEKEANMNAMERALAAKANRIEALMANGMSQEQAYRFDATNPVTPTADVAASTPAPTPITTTASLPVTTPSSADALTALKEAANWGKTGANAANLYLQPGATTAIAIAKAGTRFKIVSEKQVPAPSGAYNKTYYEIYPLECEANIEFVEGSDPNLLPDDTCSEKFWISASDYSALFGDEVPTAAEIAARPKPQSYTEGQGEKCVNCEVTTADYGDQLEASAAAAN